MKTKTITLKNLKKYTYITLGVIFTILIVGSLFPVTVTISQDTINTQVAKVLPKTISKDFTVPVTKKKIKADILIEDTNVVFQDDEVITYSSGSIAYKDKSIRFNAKTLGSEIYYNSQKYTFHYKPERVQVTLNKDDLNAVVAPIEATAKEVVAQELPQEETSNESMVSRLKNKFSFKKKEPVAELKVEEDGSFSGKVSFVEQMKAKAAEKAKVVLDKGLANQLEPALIKSIEFSVRNGLKFFPVYKLKDTEVDSTAKVFLQGLVIADGNLDIKFSLANILRSIISFVMIILLFVLVFAGIGRKSEKNDGHFGIGFLDIVSVGLDI